MEHGASQRRTSSKGNQNKWFTDGWWYKEDALGYEALAEVLVSRLLEKSNISSFVRYEYAQKTQNGEPFNCCRSRHFLESGDDKLLSVERLFQLRKGVSASAACAALPDISDRIRFVSENVEEVTGLSDFGVYLKTMLTVDALFLNEDRHFHNIAVIQRADGTFREAPLFDHGAALFSDARNDYPLKLSLDDCYKSMQAKPFSTDFDEQLDAAEALYAARPFEAYFTVSDVQQILSELQGYYDTHILSRAEEVMRRQMRKYRYLFR